MIRIFLFILLTGSVAAGQTSAFNYQGRLTDGGNPANGSFQMQFKLFDAVSGGAQQGSTLNDVAVTVTGGTFSLKLDFGSSVFTGANRWIEVSVRRNSGESYVLLTPREQIASAPFALRTLSAATADSATTAATATNFSGSLAGDVTGTQGATNVARIQGRQVSNAAPASGQVLKYNSGTSQWAPGDDNSGCPSPCTTAIFNATTQFNLNGARILSAVGTRNVSLGIDVGTNNTTGLDNSFLGTATGFSNTGGSRNSFFGSFAGFANTQGNNNVFAGVDAGNNNTLGSLNTFVGQRAGSANTEGSENSFVGTAAGDFNVTGLGNTGIGYGAGPLAPNLSFTTAIGWGAKAAANNKIVLGTSSANVVIGNNGGGNPTDGTNSNAKLNIFDGRTWTLAGWKSGLKFNNASALGWDTGGSHSFGMGGTNSGFFLFRATDYVGEPNLPAMYDFTISQDGNVGIGITNFQFAPQRLLHVNGRARIASIPVEASVAQVCFNQAGDLLQCGASSLKLKKDIRPFNSGLQTLLQLRPINYIWKEGGAADVGLGAEDVAKVAPELALRDGEGDVVGVKYERINMLLINAVKEQQKQIEALRSELEEQKKVVKRIQARRSRR